MESCGTSHYWGRRMQARDLGVQLLPVQYVRPYVRRNKTDRADTDAGMEAARCGEIRPVPGKTLSSKRSRRFIACGRSGRRPVWPRSMRCEDC